MKRLAGASVLLWALTGCGYHTGARGELLPASIKTIAVPAFGNATTRYKLTDQMAEAVAKELIARSRYRVVPDEKNADAILNGSVLNFTSNVAVTGTTGQQAVVEIHVYLKLTLTERATGKVLFNRPYQEIRERYQIAASDAPFDQKNYVEETDLAIRRAADQTARQVVSSILENF